MARVRIGVRRYQKRTGSEVETPGDPGVEVTTQWVEIDGHRHGPESLLRDVTYRGCNTEGLVTVSFVSEGVMTVDHREPPQVPSDEEIATPLRDVTPAQELINEVGSGMTVTELAAEVLTLRAMRDDFLEANREMLSEIRELRAGIASSGVIPAEPSDADPF